MCSDPSPPISVHMFTRDYLDLPLPFEEVEEAILRSPQDWIPSLAGDAETRRELLLAQVGFRPPGQRLEKQVQIELGKPFWLASKTVLPIAWRATSAESLFRPSKPTSRSRRWAATGPKLSVNAQYRPPLGAVGRFIDRAMLHRVADATIKAFLDGIGQAMTALSGSLG